MCVNLSIGFDHSDHYTLTCEVTLDFVDMTQQCHSYSITDDYICELRNRSRVEVFKVLVVLVTSDPFLRVDSSHSNTTVFINDTDEPECSKLIEANIISAAILPY